MEPLPAQRYRGPGLLVEYHKSLVSSVTSEELQSQLLKRLPRSNRRSNFTVGNEGFAYTVTFKDNTVTRYAEPWSEWPLINTIREGLELRLGTTFTYCVVQHYPSGKQISSHIAMLRYLQGSSSPA